MSKSSNTIFAQDEEIIKIQLQTDNVSLAEVVSRCEHGYPSVIILDPSRKISERTQETTNMDADHSSLANIIWLTCPFLNQKIHDIESDGYIKKINDFINSDKALVTMMNNAHANYYYLRKHLYNKYVRKNEKSNIDSEVIKTGIGGTKKIEFLKCLHMHYAHYRICSDNIAGKIVSSLLKGKTGCSEVVCGNRN